MKLPPKVHRKGPSLYYVDKGKWTKLCSADASEQVIHGEIWKLLRKGSHKLCDVMQDYKAVKLPLLALSTQTEYESVLKRLRRVFGDMHPDDLTQQDIAAYLEMREQQGHGVRGNREMAVLSSVYNHGMRIRACKINPTKGVRRNKETPRTFYVTDDQLRLAISNANPSLRHLMWASYLTGFRKSDMLGLTKENITPEGIKVWQSKDGKHELREWTESLRKVVRRAMARSKCQYVFANERGQKYSKSAVNSAFKRLKIDTGITWKFHDIRAKADSDSETGLGLMRRYNRARRFKAVK